jgi:TatD DNase family protein
MLLDSHCHLDPETWGGDGAVDEVIARAKAAGVTRMVHIGAGYGRDTFARARAVAERHEGVWFTVGVHPHDAAHWSEEVAAELRRLAAHPRMVALGEMGLDFHYDMSPRDEQRAVFRTQIRMALELNQPIVIHDRESQGETLRILDEEGAFAGRVLYHCYTGDRAHMAEIVARGGFVSIPGIVTFKTAEEMRLVAAAVPDDRLLVETDSPFLAPVPHRGKKNEPALVRVVATAVAALRGVSLEDLAERTTANALRFYGISEA